MYSEIMEMNAETSNDIFSAATDTYIPDNEPSQDSSIVNDDLYALRAARTAATTLYNNNQAATKTLLVPSTSLVSILFTHPDMKML